MKIIYSSIQGVNLKFRTTNMNKTTQGHKIIKLLKASDKEKIVKATSAVWMSGQYIIQKKKKREREKQRQKNSVRNNEQKLV